MLVNKNRFNMQNKYKALASFVLAMTMSTSSIANCGCHGSDDDTNKKMYLGLEGGFSAPLKHRFKEKISAGSSLKCQGDITDSGMYGVLMGYKFYEGMSLEGAFQGKPSYKLKITTPSVQVNTPFGLISVPSGSNTTKVKSSLYLLGLVYDLPELGKVTPYIGIDGGLARIKNTKTDIFTQIPGMGSERVMTIKKGTSNCPVLQVNLGVTSKEIAPNLKIYGATRLQIIKGVKLKYETRNPLTQAISQERFKKTLGIGEVVVGLTYDLF
jgi:hypothetical protein